jgi:hypothetical protein
MGQTGRLKVVGDAWRGNSVGFSLTVLQCSLASSPEAIPRSLKRWLSRRLDDLEHELSLLTLEWLTMDMVPIVVMRISIGYVGGNF